MAQRGTKEMKGRIGALVARHLQMFLLWKSLEVEPFEPLASRARPTFKPQFRLFASHSEQLKGFIGEGERACKKGRGKESKDALMTNSCFAIPVGFD